MERVAVDEPPGVRVAVFEELAGGVEPVAGLDVVDVAPHGVDEEPYDEPAAVGLLADDVGEGCLAVGLGLRVSSVGLRWCEHQFYYRVCVKGGQKGTLGGSASVFHIAVNKGRFCDRRGPYLRLPSMR